LEKEIKELKKKSKDYQGERQPLQKKTCNCFHGSLSERGTTTKNG